MTRAMFVTVLARLSGDTLTEQTSFSDVPAGQWYSAAVSWAAENGIVLGYPDGTFAPDKAVSREDAMTLLVRFAGWKALTLPEGGELTYADAASIQDYAKEAVAVATAAGILAGYPDGTFLPQKSITRAEAAKILSTLMKVTDYTPVEPTEPSEESTQEPTAEPTDPTEPTEPETGFTVTFKGEGGYAKVNGEKVTSVTLEPGVTWLNFNLYGDHSEGFEIGRAHV